MRKSCAKQTASDAHAAKVRKDSHADHPAVGKAFALVRCDIAPANDTPVIDCDEERMVILDVGPNPRVCLLECGCGKKSQITPFSRHDIQTDMISRDVI